MRLLRINLLNVSAQMYLKLTSHALHGIRDIATHAVNLRGLYVSLCLAHSELCKNGRTDRDVWAALRGPKKACIRQAVH